MKNGHMAEAQDWEPGDLGLIQSTTNILCGFGQVFDVSFVELMYHFVLLFPICKLGLIFQSGFFVFPPLGCPSLNGFKAFWKVLKLQWTMAL